MKTEEPINQTICLLSVNNYNANKIKTKIYYDERFKIWRVEVRLK